MKLIIKTLLLILTIYLVSASERSTYKKHKSSSKDVKIDRLSPAYIATHPAQNLGWPVIRRYRSATDVLGKGNFSKTYRKSVHASRIADRDCNKLCLDRTHKAKCPNGVEARPSSSGVLECVCLKKTLGKPKVFSQNDYCFNLNGCYSKNIETNCV